MKSKRILAVVSAGCVLRSCRNDNASVPKDVESARAELAGLSLAELSARYGEPQSSELLPFSGPLDELRVELSKLFPPDEPETKDVVLNEVQWVQADYRLTVWLQERDGKWIAVDACRWHKDVRF